MTGVPAWHARRACAGVNPAVFFPTAQTGTRTRRARLPDRSDPIWRTALTICARCPVIDDCRAAHAHETEGVWFGTIPAERRAQGYR